jgi:hypothetical protein
VARGEVAPNGTNMEALAEDPIARCNAAHTGLCQRHHILRIIWSRSGPTETWVIGTPASASMRST